MWKFFKRLFRLFSIKSNNVLEKFEDAIQTYEYELEKSQKSLNKIKDSMSKLRAEKKMQEHKREESAKKVQGIEAILDRAIEQNDDKLGEEAIALKDAEENSFKVIERNIASYAEAIEKLEEQYEALSAKHQEKMLKLEGLRAQSDYAKNMKAINDELKTHYSDDSFDLSNLSKIEDDLQRSVFYEEDRNKQAAKSAPLEERVAKQTRKSRFQEYKEKKTAPAQADVPETQEAGE